MIIWVKNQTKEDDKQKGMEIKPGIKIHRKGHHTDISTSQDVIIHYWSKITINDEECKYFIGNEVKSVQEGLENYGIAGRIDCGEI